MVESRSHKAECVSSILTCATAADPTRPTAWAQAARTNVRMYALRLSTIDPRKFTGIVNLVNGRVAPPMSYPYAKVSSR